ncbi:MAG: hypothetical protein ACKPKO_61965 [Candidatus Fonsibacter sp.]
MLDHYKTKLFQFRHSLCYSVYYFSGIQWYIFWNKIRLIDYNS